MIYAVIDTNVFISALITKNIESPTVKVLDLVLNGGITPLYHAEILVEYYEVLHRKKFNISETTIHMLLGALIKYGVEVHPQPTGDILIDLDDIIFYEVAMEKRDDDAYLITGNKKHYPLRDFIVTPAEIMEIIGGAE